MSKEMREEELRRFIRETQSKKELTSEEKARFANLAEGLTPEELGSLLLKTVFTPVTRPQTPHELTSEQRHRQLEQELEAEALARYREQHTPSYIKNPLLGCLLGVIVLAIATYTLLSNNSPIIWLGGFLFGAFLVLRGLYYYFAF